MVDLVDAYEQAWAGSDKRGYSPKALMEEPWAEGSEDKSEFYKLNTISTSLRDGPSSKAYFTIVPVILERDEAGRPLVSGVVSHIAEADGVFSFEFRPIADADSPPDDED